MPQLRAPNKIAFSIIKHIGILTVLGMLGSGENMWLAINGAITLGVSLHKEMTKLISEAGCCSWNTDYSTTCDTDGTLIMFCSRTA